MEINEHIAAVGHEAKLLAEAAKQGGIEAEVTDCPGWVMRDLVRHLAEIHLWAAARVAKRATNLWPEDISEHIDSWPDLAVFWPEDNELVDWYLQTNANLVEVLESAPLDLDCPTFLPAPSPLAMWARRQAHETAIHRYDAENAAGIKTSFDPGLAADGIDEILAAFAPRGSSFPIASPATMAVHASDTGDRWSVRLTPEGISTSREDAPADVTVSGSANALYLALWNRGNDADVVVTGNREVFDTWHENHRIRWS